MGAAFRWTGRASCVCVCLLLQITVSATLFPRRGVHGQIVDVAGLTAAGCLLVTRDAVLFVRVAVPHKIFLALCTFTRRGCRIHVELPVGTHPLLFTQLPFGLHTLE